MTADNGGLVKFNEIQEKEALKNTQLLKKSPKKVGTG